ncbi:FAD-dependent oxidoreductase [Magnetospirillum sp. UT-4]|uniref:FAD-dependent oxidoreductase n=1 Tax=Magnetospirillum sp. UT-4 TaxID=2681467 RepID=UPI001383D099|nr:FAD-dependent oxidoreductase [Magnetospirillum sp. UT-4]CAA7613936.1 Pyridine nucleotide-disulfide oxidoreductase/Methyl-viologen-reducing hydrogenase, delta subunit [Magnetospirillum sp. UT-4]
MSERKTGVYLCSGCGIGEAINVGALETVATKEFKLEPKTHACLCNDEGVGLIKADIEGGVNQVVVAACSARVMTDRFGFEPIQTLRADLREKVIWSHPAGDEDTQMLAEDYLRMALSSAPKIKAPEPWVDGDYSQRIMVLGGGVTGLSAALEAASLGHDVLLVERSDALGGHARGASKRLPHTPPYDQPEANGIEELIAKVQGNARITVRMNALVTRTAGMPGKFAVTFADGSIEDVGAIVIATGWRPYDATKLGHLGYGASPDVITSTELEKMLGQGAVARKSDGKAPQSVAFVQCAGSRDPDHLPYCSSVCCSTSLKQALEILAVNPKANVFVIYEEMRTPGVGEELYRTAQKAGVIFIKGKVKSVDGSLTVTVADELVQEDVPLQGLDMVVLATGMVPNSTNADQPASEPGADPNQLNGDVDPEAVIAVAGYCGDAPAAHERRAQGVPEGGALLNLQYRQGPHLPVLHDGFADSHYICFPYETRRTGIYTAGPVRRPMDWSEAAEDAAGAVLKAVQAVRSASAGAALHPRVGDLSYPKINLNACTKCRRCTVECPFGAIDEDEKEYPQVNATRCRRCGTCMGACPVRTISFDNYSVEMLSTQIKAVNIPDEFSGKPRILLIACENDAVPALDMAGIKRNTWSAHVRVLPVRCLGSVSLLNVSDALSAGYDGVMLMGCKPGDDYQCHFVKGSAMAAERLGKVGETLKSMMLEPERVVQAEASIADSDRLPKVIDEFVEKIVGIGFNPFKGF